MASPIAPAAPPAEYEGNATLVFGPPGTGKTTFLKNYIAEVVKRNGIDSVAIASFSVTAAQHMAAELKKTGQQLPKKAVGTLHSHAFRATEGVEVALDPKVIGSWNSEVSPEWRITPSSRGGGSDSSAFSGNPEDANTGDELLGALDKLRAQMIDPEDWPENVRKFNARYAAWKRESGAVDFTDMISLAIERARDGEPMPGNPSFFIVDEAQDNTPLEFTLELLWGAHPNIQRVVLGGDDDQAINAWRGADPRPLLALHGPNVTDKILDQSHRVPEAVRLVAERWVRNLGDRRKEKTYRPRVDEGGQTVLGAAHLVPESLDNPKLIERIQKDIDSGRTVMVLATCNYMLATVIKNLRAEGVPFHNPYRPAEGLWNPLGTAREDGMSTADRVFRYMIPHESLGDAGRLWTGEDVQAWLELINTKTDKTNGHSAGLISRAKKLAATFPPKDEVTEDNFRSLFAEEDAFNRVADLDIGWLSDNLLKAKEQPAAYPIQIVRSSGPIALATPPRVVVGTVHSVKGAAADVVYLAPDISTAAMNNVGEQSGSDEMVRTFYVGMTRAYEELRLLAPVSNRHIARKQLIPADLEVMG